MDNTVCGALLIVGCSSEDETTSTPTSTEQTITTEQTAPTQQVKSEQGVTISDEVVAFLLY